MEGLAQVCSSGLYRLLYMVPFCLVGIFMNVFFRTIFTIYPSYNMPVLFNFSASLPDLNLVYMEVSVIPSVFFSINIWIQLSFVSAVLTLSMPFGAIKRAFSEVGHCKKLTAITSAVVALMLAASVFIFVYRVYVTESFSALQPILCVPFLTFIVYSSCEGHVLPLDCFHAFPKFHIALRIIFNCVTIQQGICVIVISLQKPADVKFALLSIIGLLYRIWVAIKYTNFLKMRPGDPPDQNYDDPPDQNDPPDDPPDQNDPPNQNDDDNDYLVVPRTNTDNVYRVYDAKAKPETYGQEPRQDVSHEESKSFIVVNVSLFYNYWKKLTHLQFVNLLLAFNMTVVYMAICYILFILTRYYFGSFHLFKTATLVTGITVTLSRPSVV